MLAKSCMSMDTSRSHLPFCCERPAEDFGKPFRKSFIIHNDIKDENIFLGDKLTGWDLPWDNYPCPKMADFGLSQVTSMSDTKNQARWTRPGTIVWQPREKRRHRRSKELPTGTDRMERPKQHLDVPQSLHFIPIGVTSSNPMKALMIRTIIFCTWSGRLLTSLQSALSYTIS